MNLQRRVGKFPSCLAICGGSLKKRATGYLREKGVWNWHTSILVDWWSVGYGLHLILDGFAWILIQLFDWIALIASFHIPIETMAVGFPRCLVFNITPDRQNCMIGRQKRPTPGGFSQNCPSSEPACQIDDMQQAMTWISWMIEVLGFSYPSLIILNGNMSQPRWGCLPLAKRSCFSEPKKSYGSTTVSVQNDFPYKNPHLNSAIDGFNTFQGDL